MIQYSSNEGDLVCDFFLGGFSTAKVALGLNRRATGFEISKPMFETRIKEIKVLKPGYLVPALRQATISTLENPGKSWSEEDLQRLQSGYDQLIAEGVTKKEIIAQLGKELSRGRFSIEKALKKIEPVIKKETRKKTLSEFF